MARYITLFHIIAVMPLSLRIVLNCLATIIVLIVVVWLMAWFESVLLQKGMSPASLLSHWFSGTARSVAAIVYDVIRFAVFASLGALVMVFFRPRFKIAYCLSSLAATAYLLQIVATIGLGHWPSILIIVFWMLSIPALYLLFCRIAEARHNKSLNTDAGNAGAA